MASEFTDKEIAAAYVRHKAGDLAFAESAYREVLRRHPDHPIALQYMALVHFSLGQHDQAISSLKQSIQSDPTRAPAHAELGRIYALLKKEQAALDSLTTAVEIDPQLSDAWHNLGLVRSGLKNIRGAFEAFRTALRTNPKRTDSLIELASLLYKEGQLTDAKRALELAIKANPDDIDGHLLLAQTVANLGYTSESLEQFRDILKKAPTHPDAWLSFGQVLEDQGNQTEAIHAYRQALKLEPGSGLAIGRLLALLPQEESAELIKIAQEALHSAAAPDEAKALVGYGLGRLWDREKNYDAAFEAYRLANEARERDAGEFDRADLQRRFERHKAGYPLSWPLGAEALEASPVRPVFIVGMPRSGTTLTEQILSSVQCVHGVGELPTIDEVSRDLEALCASQSGDWPGWLKMAPKEIVRQARQTYFDKLMDGCGANTRVAIDKLPLNFIQLGFIASIFPEARIIHCRRDPRDVCWSIYTQNFAHTQRHSTSLKALGEYWRAYDVMMGHWQKALSLPIIEVQYEETIADVEAMSRRLCDFIGVEWDEQTLAFHKSDRTVRTPSRWQVRQPIYKSSAGKWKRYEKHLGPLLEALE